MSENVIREDIIRIGFDTNMKILNDILDDLDNIKKSIGGVGDEDGFDKAKRHVQDTDKKTKKLKESLEKVGKTAAGAAYKGLKKMASVSFKGLAAGATAVSGMVAASVKAYADTEQLIGGVDTIFKKDSKTVQKYANDAYKTAGLSANEYMETVTGFSASLIQSLKGDTTKAAKYADMAISDMADNANKYGSDIGSIQNAYAGFSKQNYTMLDNLNTMGALAA